MKNLHDLRIMLSCDARLSKTDCLRIKGGADGDLRRGRPTAGKCVITSAIDTAPAVRVG